MFEILKTDYKFIRAAPLFELMLPNMDFLLFRKNSECNIAIFGECKGSFSDPSAVIKELEERRAHIEQNREYIITNYLRLSMSERVHFEYVIAVPDKDAARMQSCLIDKKGDFILWQTSLAGKREISCIFPPRSLDPKENMMHMDPSLRKVFEGSKPIACSRVMINYFPQSYEFNKISVLLEVAKFNRSNESEWIVTITDLRAIIKKYIFYMNYDFISSQVAYVISKGLEIGFLEKSSEAEDEYLKITTNPRKSDSLGRHLRTKWIKNKLKIEFERKKQEAIIEVRRKYEKARRQRTLFDY